VHALTWQMINLDMQHLMYWIQLDGGKRNPAVVAEVNKVWFVIIRI
jgi:hypothetical protein